jgi:hypothetical protein
MISITPTRMMPSVDDAQCRSFEITDGNGRVSCTLTTHFKTRDQANRYFHSNRPLLEQLARKKMASFGLDNGKIRLVLLP